MKKLFTFIFIFAKIDMNSKENASMEKFEMDEEKRLEVFNNFVGKAKDALTTLIEDIKTNIKKYEQAIEDTTKEIEDTESSRERCEHEITKMEGKIESIKETIDNVENTYKKMVDAYSSTSKGETKELYSDIIDGAKANCEKDVEKNRSEIARLNSDIEAIKNNIAEFTKIIDELNKDLEGYKLELSKYNKAAQYMETCEDKVSSDLDDISLGKEEPKKKEPKTVKRSTPKKEKVEVVEEEPEEEDDSTTAEELVIEEPEEIVIEEETPEEVVGEEPETVEISEPTLENVDFELSEPEKTEEPVKKAEPLNFEDSLKQIYDLTGYKPKKEDKKEEPVEEKTVYTENLESLFATPSEDVKPEKELSNSFDENDMSEWERILNGADDIFTNLSPNTKEVTEEKVEPAQPVEVKKTITENFEDTVNQLLKPYGTSFDRLKSLTSNKITYKDGSSIPFELSTEDVIKVINAVDGTDLKKMKTVGPEITLLRKIKNMKEGKM